MSNTQQLIARPIEPVMSYPFIKEVPLDSEQTVQVKHGGMGWWYDRKKIGKSRTM